MTSWIVTGVLYVLGIGIFHWLGGLAAAGDAIARWGSAAAEERRPAVSPMP